MTETFSKLPMAGTRISIGVISSPSRRLQNELADVAQNVGKTARKARSERAVNDPMIVGKAERQHQTRLEGLAVPDGLHRCAHNAEDGKLGCIDNGRKIRPTDAAQA